MKNYVVDTNIFLRFFLKDNDQHYTKARQYFKQAEDGKISLIILPQVIFEIEYVLSQVYQITKSDRCETLSSIVQNPHFSVARRAILIKAIDQYRSIQVDLVDLYLAHSAQDRNATVLSFDKDFKKITVE